MRIGDTVRWECWDSRDVPQEVKIVGYSDKNNAWEIETKSGLRWFVSADAGTLFPITEGRMNKTFNEECEPLKQLWRDFIIFIIKRILTPIIGFLNKWRAR